jgi:general secretion pathway protein J
MSASPQATGFTLVEVMVAIVLMALIGLIGWRGMDSVARTSSRLEADAEQAQAVRRTLDQLAHDVAMRATVELPPPAVAASEIDEDGRAHPLRLLPQAMISSRPPPGSLHLEIVRRADSGAGGGLQRVAWWRQGTRLYRAAGLPSPRFPLPAPQSADAIAVLDAVEVFELRAWEPGKGWQRLPAAGRATPAQGLELVLRQQTGAGQAAYRRVLLLH